VDLAHRQGDVARADRWLGCGWLAGGCSRDAELGGPGASGWFRYQQERTSVER